MKKLKLLTVGLLMLFAFGTNAAESPVKDTGNYKILVRNYEVSARCDVVYKGFHGKGNCDKVLAALARYKQITGE